MKYSDIINALPLKVSEIVQRHLDAVHMTEHMSESEVKELLDDAINLAKAEIIIDDEDKLRMVDALLAGLSAAGIKAIFGSV